MPGVALHLVVARSVLEGWRVESSGPPFDPDDPRAINAFYHGAVGPDLGYFPGGHRPLSDLAHGLHTGHLVRRLVQTASSELEKAFAWGWLTHVLADRDVHPWIGRGVGALRTDSRADFVDGASDPCGHLRVEMGLDAWFAARQAWTRTVRLHAFLDSRHLELLVDAYRETYGTVIPRHLFLSSHKAVVTGARQALSTHRALLALRNGGAVERLLPSMAGWLRRAATSRRLRCVALSYLTPVAPQRWLIRGVDREVSAQTRRFLEQVRTRLVTLGDHNLDTGDLIHSNPDHPGTRRARAAIQTFRKSVDAPSAACRPALSEA